MVLAYHSMGGRRPQSRRKQQLERKGAYCELRNTCRHSFDMDSERKGLPLLRPPMCLSAGEPDAETAHATLPCDTPPKKFRPAKLVGLLGAAAIGYRTAPSRAN